MRLKQLTPEECQKIRSLYERPMSLKLLKESEYPRRGVIALAKAIRLAGGAIRSRGRVPAKHSLATFSDPVIEVPIVDVEPVFSNKLEELEAILGFLKPAEPPPPLNNEVVETVLDYALGFNDGRTFRKIDRRYNYEGRLSQFRKDHLENNYYIMGRLWRAIFRSVTYRNINLQPYGVAPSDVKFCVDFLSDEKKRKIRKWVKTTPHVHLPNERGVHEVVAKCEKTLKSIVNQRLRFIVKYDPCHDTEDLISFLRLIAYRVAVKYDWEMESGRFAFEKCLNYTKRSLWNASSLMVKQNTSEEYARLVRVDSGERIYQTTTISIDSNDEWLSFEKNLSAPEDRTVEIVDLLKKVGDDKLIQYLRLDIEDVPEFDVFVRERTGRSEEDVYAKNYAEWRVLALSFSGLTKKVDRLAYKRKMRKEMGTWEDSRVWEIQNE